MDAPAPHPKAEAFQRLSAQMKTFRRELLARANEVLASTEWAASDVRILDRLWHTGSMSQSELANELSLDQAMVSRAVHRLVKAGHLEVEIDPNDRRARRVSLSTAGRASFKATFEPLFVRMLDRFDAVPLEELEALVAAFTPVLQRLGVAPEQYERECGDGAVGSAERADG